MNKQYEIEVDGNTIHVSRKKIKNMYLRIKKDDARIEVSAPLKMKDAQIIAFIKSRRDWINDARSRAEKLMEREKEVPVLAPISGEGAALCPKEKDRGADSKMGACHEGKLRWLYD